MPVLKVPRTLTGITINTTVRPITNDEITVTAAEAAVIVPQQFQPRVVKTLDNGECFIQLPIIINSLSIGGTPYGATAEGVINNVGALAAVSFLGWSGKAVFEYARD